MVRKGQIEQIKLNSLSRVNITLTYTKNWRKYFFSQEFYEENMMVNLITRMVSKEIVWMLSVESDMEILW